MQVYYFTRTGRSKVIAEELAARLGVKANAIEDSKSWAGAWGYMKAGYMAATKKTLPAIYQKPIEDEEIALVFPVWAGSFPPAVRAFIGELGRGRIVCIPTSLGSNLVDRGGFVKIIDLVGKNIALPEVL